MNVITIEVAPRSSSWNDYLKLEIHTETGSVIFNQEDELLGRTIEERNEVVKVDVRDYTRDYRRHWTRIYRSIEKS